MSGTGCFLKFMSVIKKQALCVLTLIMGTQVTLSSEFKLEQPHSLTQINFLKEIPLLSRNQQGEFQAFAYSPSSTITGRGGPRKSGRSSGRWVPQSSIPHSVS